MNTIYFYSVNNDYGCFSNFSPHPVTIEGITYQTAEHYFQSMKFKDKAIKKRIIQAKTPNDAAKLGRSREFPIRKDWESIKDEVMLKAIRAKMEQHQDFRNTLRSTQNAIIIEHTENDRYWADGGDGSGKNRLGKILMKVRDEYKK